MESSKRIKRLDTQSIESLYKKLSHETRQLLGLRFYPRTRSEYVKTIQIFDNGEEKLVRIVK